METLRLLYDWPEAAARGADILVYAIAAAVGTTLFLARLGVSALFGGDVDVNADVDFDGIDATETDAAFKFFSLQAILAFIMGIGWAGLAARMEWKLGQPFGFIAALAGGVGLTLLEVMVALQVRKLASNGGYDVRTAVGRTGRCYLTIPAAGQGTGQVQVTVSGRQKVMTAESSGPKINAFDEVIIEAADVNETLTVRPKHEAT